MEIIPAVDVLGGSVVRLRQGAFDTATEYGDDPVAAARGWQQAGAALVHVVDLDGARTGRPNVDLWRALQDAEVSFQAAGGIRSISVAGATLEAGAGRVVVGTIGVWSPSVLAQMVSEFGSDRVVGAVDIRGGFAHGSGWEDAGRPIDEVLDDMTSAGVGRLMITSIGRDGTQRGPEIDLTAHIAERATVPVIASGGVGGLDDLRKLAGTRVEAVVVGRALYERTFSFEEAVAAVGGPA